MFDQLANTFENGGTIGQHIVDMAGSVISAIVLIVKHVGIIWGTIWF